MFGISAAPEMYQYVIHQVIRQCAGCANISDDIIVYGKDEQEHDKNLRNVLAKLRERGLTVNKQKCQFGMSQLVFMGHVLSRHGIGPDHKKVDAVANARNPENSAEVRGFLGLVNFCARYIPDLATIAEPLRRLTRAKEKWCWDSSQQTAFDELKRRLTHASAMAYYDPDADTKVIVDASPVGLGAVLSQKQSDDSIRPVYYVSRALTDVTPKLKKKP